MQSQGSGALIISLATALSTTGAIAGPPESWRDRVVYEIFVRSFHDSANGTLAGDGIGDIPGLISRLDYLNDGNPRTSSDLGISAIWLMPIHPSPSYHGYDITDYKAINPQYGTLDDFKKLVTECRARGIEVMIDLVINHTSDRHPWFVSALDPNSPMRSRYIWSDRDPGWKGPWNQIVWHKRGEQWLYGLFYHAMPDLNFRDADVTREVDDIVRFWTREVGVSGLRLDAIRHLIESGQVQENTPETLSWLQGFQDRLKTHSPEAFTIGEVWSPSVESAKYVPESLDATFDFELASAMMNAAKSGDATALRIKEREVAALYPSGGYGRFLTNHDQNRVMSELNGDEAKARVAAAIMLTGPGIPFVYYGEEIGMKGAKPDELIRTPMQWSPSKGGGFTTGTPWQDFASDSATRSVELMDQAGDSLISTYRELISLRSKFKSLSRGETVVLESSDKSVYALLRVAAGEPPVMTVVNTGAAELKEVTLTCEKSSLSGVYRVSTVRGDYFRTADAKFGGGGALSYVLNDKPLPAHGCAVFVLTRN